MPELASPIGLLIRPPDKFASKGGAYHAARSTDGRSRQHEGVDLLAVPGTPVVAPMTSVLVRVADPYEDRKDAELLGLVLRSMSDPSLELKFLYVDPIRALVGKTVGKGQVVGRVQTLQKLYPGIADHVHVEVWLQGERVDPTPFFFDLSAQGPPVTTT